jgi:hypothetical protein
MSLKDIEAMGMCRDCPLASRSHELTTATKHALHLRPDSQPNKQKAGIKPTRKRSSTLSLK